MNKSLRKSWSLILKIVIALSLSLQSLAVNESKVEAQRKFLKAYFEQIGLDLNKKTFDLRGQWEKNKYSVNKRYWPAYEYLTDRLPTVDVPKITFKTAKMSNGTEVVRLVLSPENAKEVITIDLVGTLNEAIRINDYKVSVADLKSGNLLSVINKIPYFKRMADENMKAVLPESKKPLSNEVWSKMTRIQKLHYATILRRMVDSSAVVMKAFHLTNEALEKKSASNSSKSMGKEFYVYEKWINFLRLLRINSADAEESWSEIKKLNPGEQCINAGWIVKYAQVGKNRICSIDQIGVGASSVIFPEENKLETSLFNEVTSMCQQENPGNKSYYACDPRSYVDTTRNDGKFHPICVEKSTKNPKTQVATPEPCSDASPVDLKGNNSAALIKNMLASDSPLRKLYNIPAECTDKIFTEDPKDKVTKVSGQANYDKCVAPLIKHWKSYQNLSSMACNREFLSKADALKEKKIEPNAITACDAFLRREFDIAVFEDHMEKGGAGAIPGDAYCPGKGGSPIKDGGCGYDEKESKGFFAGIFDWFSGIPGWLKFLFGAAVGFGTACLIFCGDKDDKKKPDPSDKCPHPGVIGEPCLPPPPKPGCDPAEPGCPQPPGPPNPPPCETTNTCPPGSGGNGSENTLTPPPVNPVSPIKSNK